MVVAAPLLFWRGFGNYGVDGTVAILHRSFWRFLAYARMGLMIGKWILVGFNGVKIVCGYFTP